METWRLIRRNVVWRDFSKKVGQRSTNFGIDCLALSSLFFPTSTLLFTLIKHTSLHAPLSYLTRKFPLNSEWLCRSFEVGMQLTSSLLSLVYFTCSTLPSTQTALVRLSTHSLRSTSRFRLISSYTRFNHSSRTMSTSSCPFTTDTAPQCWGHRGVCYSLS